MSYRGRRYESAVVQSVLRRTVDHLIAVGLDDRTIVTTPDHVFITPHQVDGRRRSPAKDLEGRHVRVSSLRGWEPDESVRTADWWHGWASGLIAGDGHVGVERWPKIFLQVTDEVLARAYCRVLNEAGSACTVREASRRTASGKVVYRVSHTLARAPWIPELPSGPDEVGGWLAGFFDAEGSLSRGQLTIAQAEDKTSERVQRMLAGIGITSTLQPGRGVCVNGLAQIDRFLRVTRPLLDRNGAHRRPNRLLRASLVRSVEPVPGGSVVNLSTSTGFFFADGVLVENCDTPFTWDWERFDPAVELREVDVAELVAEVAALGVDRVVVTGGEPLLQQRRLVPFLEAAAARGWAVEVETNGTITPEPAVAALVERFNVSPKLANSGVAEERRIVGVALAAFVATGKASFKFVVAAPAELDQVAAMVERHSLAPVVVMPEGTTAAAVLAGGRALADAVAARGWHLTTRLHVLLWGEERGR
ncbi:MAG: hypothetical protein M3527_03430 [Actinomycetota bacterium]|nr:hypothetical protein [Actinomycetota bacterium]